MDIQIRDLSDKELSALKKKIAVEQERRMKRWLRKYNLSWENHKAEEGVKSIRKIWQYLPSSDKRRILRNILKEALPVEREEFESMLRDIRFGEELEKQAREIAESAFGISQVNKLNNLLNKADEE